MERDYCRSSNSKISSGVVNRFPTFRRPRCFGKEGHNSCAISEAMRAGRHLLSIALKSVVDLKFYFAHVQTASGSIVHF